MTLPKKWRRISGGMDYRAWRRRSPILANWRQVGEGMVTIPVMYVHKRTNEVRYDKPKSEDELAQSIPEAVFDREYDRRVNTQEHGPPETLPEDWEQHENQEEVLTVWFKGTNPRQEPTGVCYDPPLKHKIVVKTLSNAAMYRDGLRRIPLGYKGTLVGCPEGLPVDPPLRLVEYPRAKKRRLEYEAKHGGPPVFFS